MNLIIKHFSAVLFVSLLFITIGCAPGIHLIEPQFDSTLKIFENNNNIVFKVLDERKTNPYLISGYDNRNIEYTIPIEGVA